MSQVRVAFRACNRSPLHANRLSVSPAHFLRNRRPEARPAGARIKLRRRTEQCVVATDAPKNPLVVQIPILPGVGNFGIRVPRNLKLSRRKLLPPFVFRLHHLRDLHLPSRLPASENCTIVTSPGSVFASPQSRKASANATTAPPPAPRPRPPETGAAKRLLPLSRSSNQT